MLKQVEEMTMANRQSNTNAQLQKQSVESQNTRENQTISICSSSRLLDSNLINKIDDQSLQEPQEQQLEASWEGKSIDTYKIQIEYILRNKSELQNQSGQHPKIKEGQKRVAIFKEITLEHYLSLFLRELREVRPRLVDLFNSYLSSHKKIYRFLQHLYYSYPIDTVSQLLKYEFYIWELYYPYIGCSLSSSEAEEMRLQICERVVGGEVEAREKRNLEKVDEEYLRELMAVLTHATIFIMEDYQMDSLMCQQRSRRPQEGQNANPRKMIKQNQ